MQSLDVGLDLSRSTDRWEAFATALVVEPYIEAHADHFPERELTLHYMPPTEGIDLSVLLGSNPNIKNYQKHTDRESLTEASGHDMTKLIRSGVAIKPIRKTPCVGVQNWFDIEPRERSLLVLLDSDNCPSNVARECFDANIELSAFSWSIAHSATEFYALVNHIQYADMVVTDNAAIALIASAFSVPKVTCLTMFGDASLFLENTPDVKIFKRKSSDLDSQYEALLDFANREWNRYVRYPDLLNTGNAQAFIQNTALQYCRGYGLDVGSNKWPFYGALASDVNNRQFDKAPFDFIFSSHCLEHIKGWEDELKLWHASLKPDGIAFIYVPHPLMEMWLPEGPWVKGGWHVWSPEPMSLFRYVRRTLGMEVLHYTTRPDAYWSFHLVARKK